MTKESRIRHIQEITESGVGRIGTIEILWQDDLEPMDIYKIPLKYLVYNKYNGRILSRTKSLETQSHKLDPVEDKEKIENLLWHSKVDRNKKTKESLIDHGQQKVGIITKDGVIIDGNRRAMLLNKIDKYDYFKAVVLPVESGSEGNSLEIEKLETTYQMGEDEKLGYNPIEKYLKAKVLLSKLTPLYDYKDAIKKISEWMGESTTEVEKYLSVMETMDDYLESLDYDGIYTQLDGREDQFINLTKWINNFYGESSSKPFDGYEDDDVDDLKNIAYDYIRVKFEGKNFRKLAEGLQDKHLFGDRNIWTTFKKLHNEKVEPILDNESKIDFNIGNIQEHLNARDNKYKQDILEFLQENLDNHYDFVRNRQYKDKPEKLIKNAKKAIETISPNHELIKSETVQNEIESLKDEIDELLLRSPLKTLSYINTLLDELDLDGSNNKEKLLQEVKKINKTSHILKKYLGA